MRELLTAEAVAKVLGRHPGTVLRMAREGELPHVFLGGHGIRFREEDLEAFIAGRVRNAGDA